jgi:hypothetical protein
VVVSVGRARDPSCYEAERRRSTAAALKGGGVVATAKKKDTPITRGRKVSSRPRSGGGGSARRVEEPSVGHSGLARAAARMRETTQRCDTWVRSGSPVGEEPWRDVDWTSITYLPEGRDLLRLETAHAGVRSLGELRDMLGLLGDRVRTMYESGRNAAFTPLAEVLFALRDGIIAEGDLPAWHPRPAIGRPRKYGREGVDVAGLEPLIREARAYLQAKGGADSRRALFLDFQVNAQGEVTQSGFGERLVADLMEAKAHGLRGPDLANHLAASPVWQVSPFHKQRDLRWKQHTRAGLWPKLLAWCAQDLPTNDAEEIAVSLLVALGVTRKRARNAVMAAADNRAARQGKKRK